MSLSLWGPRASSLTLCWRWTDPLGRPPTAADGPGLRRPEAAGSRPASLAWTASSLASLNLWCWAQLSGARAWAGCRRPARC
eukprot:scaffold462001_cov48-Prasinocladus_malaysianus.AAC.2